MAADNERPIIIKKKKGGHGHAHHGGAWKVAYADFVTAMMAFFLLLWLLSVATDEQRGAVADYFSPASLSRETSGAGGVLGGLTVAAPGAMSSPSSPFSLESSLPGRPEAAPDSVRIEPGDLETTIEDAIETWAGFEDLEAFRRGTREMSAEEFLDIASELSDAQFEQAMAEWEQRQFEQAAEQLRQAIQAVPDLERLRDNIVVDQTPDGLRIQLVDQHQQSMFPLGAAQMNDAARELHRLIVEAVRELPQRILIAGHTDATPFARDTSYGNWELSTDRANASRRALIEAGLPAERIATVVGRADTDPLFPEDPRDPRNRRISITLLRDAPGAPG